MGTPTGKEIKFEVVTSTGKVIKVTMKEHHLS